MGSVVPSPSPPFPSSDCSCCEQSDLLELHIRLEWVRRTQTMTKPCPAQPSPTEKGEEAQEEGEGRGEARGCSSCLGEGPSCQPPVLVRALGPWNLGTLVWKGTGQQSQANQPIGPCQTAISSTISKQPAGNQATSDTQLQHRTALRPDRASICDRRPAPFAPCSLLDFSSVS